MDRRGQHRWACQFHVYLLRFLGRSHVVIACRCRQHQPGVQMSFYKGFTVTPDGLLLLAWSRATNCSWLQHRAIGRAPSARAWRTFAMGPGTNPTLACSSDGARWYLAYWSDASRWC